MKKFDAYIAIVCFVVSYLFVCFVDVVAQQPIQWQENIV
jgi:hypothetical protein